MLRTLLAERFGLQVRRESRQQTGYMLELGPNLRPSSIDCTDVRAKVATGDLPRPQTDDELAACTLLGRDFRTRHGSISMAEWTSTAN